MKKLLPIALAAPMILIGAAYPEDKPGYAPVADAASAPVTYRPCRPGRGDDRCIQLYERGVRASYARWLRDRGVRGDRTEVAMGGPVEERAQHSRRRYSGHGDDSAQGGGRHGGGDDHRCHHEPSARGDARGM